MSIYRNVTAAALTCALALPVVAQADTTANQVGTKISNAVSAVDKEATDTAITTKIKALLAAESDIKSLKIHVTTKNHVVHLSGNVDTGLQADKVIEIAQSVDGVTDVDNAQLIVKSSDKYTQDALITAKAKGTIMQLSNNNKINSGSDLRVETTNGAVHIFGTVTNSDDIEKIKTAVTAIAGVKSVNTDIKAK